MFNHSSNQAFNHSNLVNAGGHHITLNVAVTDTAAPPCVNHVPGRPSSPDWEPLSNLKPTRSQRAKRVPYGRSLRSENQSPASNPGPTRSRSKARGATNRLRPLNNVYHVHSRPGADNEESSQAWNTGYIPLQEVLCPPVIPSYSKTQDDIPGYPSAQPQSASPGIDINSLERLDIYPQNLQEYSRAPTHSEVYERQMYSKGHGYPCSNPQPLGSPAKIGDVGILGNDGFQAICNLYNLPSESSLAACAPDIAILYQPGKFLEGDTVTSGIANTELTYSDDNKFVDEYQFHCQGQQGAMLAVTSPADLETLKDNTRLGDFLRDNATQLYRYVQTLQRLDPQESLYVVTGLIKSDSWAIATYNEWMQAPNNVVTLKNRGFIHPDRILPTYSWTQKGKAETRRGSSTTKDQCLFLRGFLMTPSLGFASHSSGAQDGNTDSPYPDSDTQYRRDNDGGREDPSSRFNRQADSSSNLGPGPSTSLTHGFSYCQDIFVESYPRLAKSNSAYPSQRINDTLLQENKADIAITHDDDWRHILKGRHWEEDEASSLLLELKQRRRLEMIDGVTLWRTERPPSATCGNLSIEETPNLQWPLCQSLYRKNEDVLFDSCHQIAPWTIAWDVNTTNTTWFTENTGRTLTYVDPRGPSLSIADAVPPDRPPRLISSLDTSTHFAATALMDTEIINDPFVCIDPAYSFGLNLPEGMAPLTPPCPGSSGSGPDRLDIESNPKHVEDSPSRAVKRRDLRRRRAIELTRQKTELSGSLYNNARL